MSQTATKIAICDIVSGGGMTIDQMRRVLTERLRAHPDLSWRALEG